MDRLLMDMDRLLMDMDLCTEDLDAESFEFVFNPEAVLGRSFDLFPGRPRLEGVPRCGVQALQRAASLPFPG